MIGKITYLLALVVTVIVAAEPAADGSHRIDSADKQSHDFVIGYRVSGDRPVYNQQVLRQPVSNQVVTAQQTFYVGNVEKITQIIVRDTQW